MSVRKLLLLELRYSCMPEATILLKRKVLYSWPTRAFDVTSAKPSAVQVAELFHVSSSGDNMLIDAFFC